MTTTNTIKYSEIAKIIMNNKQKTLELLFKATGGGICLTSLTDILINAELISEKTKTRWFKEYHAITFDELCLNNGYLPIRIPNGMNFKDFTFIENKTGFQTTTKSFLALSRLATSRDQVVAVMMGYEKINGYNENHNLSSAQSVAAMFRKYFGEGLPVFEKLKHVDEKNIPDFISLNNCKSFWNAYLKNPHDWQEDFLLSLEAEENSQSSKMKENHKQHFELKKETIEWLKNDCESTRKQAQKDFLNLFL